MRHILVGIAFIAGIPIVSGAQQISKTQRPVAIVPPILAPPVTGSPIAPVLPSGQYVLTLTVPHSDATGQPVSRRLPTTLTHAGNSVGLALGHSTSLNGDMIGNAVTLRGSEPHGNAIAIDMTATGDRAAGSLVVSTSQGQHSAGTATLARALSNAPAEMRNGGSDGPHCSGALECWLHDVFHIDFDPVQ